VTKQAVVRFTAQQMESLAAIDTSTREGQADAVMAVWDILAPGWREPEQFSVVGHPPLDRAQVTELIDGWVCKMSAEDRSAFMLLWVNNGPVSQ